MKTLAIIFSSLLFIYSCTPSQNNEQQAQETADTTATTPQEEEWISLFNGEDLSGWHVKIRGHELDDNYNNTFRVEDGMMKVRYDQYDDFAQQYGHIFYEKPYSHYKFRVEYRFVGEQAPQGEGWAWRNSGIMVHGQSPESMGLEQDFPISIEVQLLGGSEESEDERTTCNLCTPGTNVVMDGELVTQHCINSTSETLRGDQWVTAEVVVMGDSVIHHLVNGDTVLTYQQPQMGGGTVSGHDESVKIDGQLLKEGYISLQSESHPVDFRKIEILPLEE
ncbi:3-keto-disaccharide hydrolase [Catalinimonas niigatensis]|uniref:3-keto-disaccharide hydrolase n=1 Tax=Catalinimonas niigatensis TaxID=1397264 RepID=UPI002665323C|nr:DUF1080 domain-containing protein [Catalinimonas niigatensis]WPP52437.1 DUF1080 domain-containing protein [Catalinimonas niigatensis]